MMIISAFTAVPQPPGGELSTASSSLLQSGVLHDASSVDFPKVAIAAAPVPHPVNEGGRERKIYYLIYLICLEVAVE